MLLAESAPPEEEFLLKRGKDSLDDLSEIYRDAVGRDGGSRNRARAIWLAISSEWLDVDGNPSRVIQGLIVDFSTNGVD